MTTTIKVTSHNHPALVTTIDVYVKPQDDGTVVTEERRDERVVKPADGEVVIHCTTSRTISVVDLEYDDPRAA